MGLSTPNTTISRVGHALVSVCDLMWTFKQGCDEHNEYAK